MALALAPSHVLTVYIERNVFQVWLLSCHVFHYRCLSKHNTSVDGRRIERQKHYFILIGYDVITIIPTEHRFISMIYFENGRLLLSICSPLSLSRCSQENLFRWSGQHTKCTENRWEQRLYHLKLSCMRMYAEHTLLQKYKIGRLRMIEETKNGQTWDYFLFIYLFLIVVFWGSKVSTCWNQCCEP